MGKWLLPHPEKSNHTTEISFPPEDLRIQCRKSLSPRWICEIHCRALVPLGSPNVKMGKRGVAFPYPLIFKEDPSYYRMRQGPFRISSMFGTSSCWTTGTDGS